MRLTYLEIEFFETSGQQLRRIYNVGSYVSGQVKVGFSKPAKLAGINLKVNGEGRTKWMEPDGDSSTAYKAKETYIDLDIILFGGISEDFIIHPPGDYTYPFSFLLSEEIPSSFKGRHGSVRYSCTAFIDRLWKDGEAVSEDFFVLHQLDCNHLVHAMMPIEATGEEMVQVCCDCFNDPGLLIANLRLEKTAYVPGEPIVYNIEIVNRSSQTIEGVYLLLYQTITYKGHSRSTTHYKIEKQKFILSEDVPYDIPPHQTKKFNGATIIPSLPPSKLDGCSFIDIEYLVKLKISSVWCRLFLERAIVIGSIPVRRQSARPSAPPITGRTTSPSQIELSVQDPTSNDEMSPPSYEECMVGNYEIKDDEGNPISSSGNPVYPYYDWKKQTSYTGPPPSSVRLFPSQD